MYHQQPISLSLKLHYVVGHPLQTLKGSVLSYMDYCACSSSGDTDACALRRKLLTCSVVSGDISMEQPSVSRLYMISSCNATRSFSRLLLSLWTLCWLARTSHRPISQTVWLEVPPFQS
eukprot:435467-Pelagomonas_calceolata.AAC.1